MLLPVGRHHVQRVHGDRPLGPAAAADIAIGQSAVAAGVARFRAALDVLPAPRRQEHDLAVGQIASVEIVVLAVRQPPHAAAVQVHFVQVKEGVFRDVVLVQLVGLAFQTRIVLAVTEQDPRAIVRQVRPQERARRKSGGQTPQTRLVGFEVFQDEHAAARPREPAVVLVRHVRKAAGHAFHEQQVVKIQQRIGHRHPPHRPAGLQIQLPPLSGRNVLAKVPKLLFHFAQNLFLRRHLGPQPRRSAASAKPRFSTSSTG